jgi:pSer/pThr/pTyr-binding forkhead associated (FHA) protein
MEVRLLVLEGKQKGRAIPLPETIFMIGRDRQCHIRPHCELVSKLHCAIAAWAGKVRLRDLKSKNGTFLNGQPVHGEVVVDNGDRLQVGTLIFEFQIKREEETPILAPPPKDNVEVDWLLQSPNDSGVLSPGSETAVLPAPTAEAAPEPAAGKVTRVASEAAAKTAGSKALSAGPPLRPFLEKRKRRQQLASLADKHMKQGGPGGNSTPGAPPPDKG